MAESGNLTYYQRKRDVILNRAKNYHENDQERLREQAKKRNKDIKKIIARQESLNTIVNKIVFLNCDVSACSIY